MTMTMPPRATYGCRAASRTRLFRNPAKRWGVRLYEANTMLCVRCYSCQGVGLVQDPDEDGRRLERADWPVVACMFTNGCRGVAVPEVLN